MRDSVCLSVRYFVVFPFSLFFCVRIFLEYTFQLPSHSFTSKRFFFWGGGRGGSHQISFFMSDNLLRIPQYQQLLIQKHFILYNCSVRWPPCCYMTQCHLYVCTELLIYISALSKLRESTDISAVRYTNLNGIVQQFVSVHCFNLTQKLASLLLPYEWWSCLFFFILTTQYIYFFLMYKI